MKIDNPILLGEAAGFGIPAAGTSGQVLRKVDGTNYNTQWADNGLPAGGTSGQSLVKNSSTSGDASWVNYIPTGGTAGQYLGKRSGTSFDTVWTAGTTPVYLSVNKNSAQSIPFSTETTLLDWNGTQVNNTPSAWNSSTGTFTCPTAGTYDISLSLMLSNVSPDNIFKEFAPIISFNGVPYIASWWSTYTNVTTNTPTITVRYILQLSVGDIIRPRVYQDLRLNTSYGIVTGRNAFTITQLPNKLL
jgi:hypothetical protein